MVNYNNGKIYKIEPLNGEEGEIYIGSTTKKLLSQRMTKHRGHYKEWLNGKNKKITSFDLFDKYGLDNCKIILLELVNAKSKDELVSREAFYIRSLDCVNKVIPGRTDKEYYKDNKDKFKQINKEYREDNKDKYKIYYKEYDKKVLNCDCGSVCRFHEKSRHFKTKKHQEFISKTES
jgi:hypothetical protein